MFNQIVMGLIACYVFICAIPYTPAAKYSLLGALAVTAIAGLIQKRFQPISRSPVVLSLGLFVCIALISAVLSPYMADSLQSFRKEYLPPLFLLVLATSLRQEPAEKSRFAKAILWALIAGFCLKTLLALWDGAINHPFIFSPYTNPDFYEKNGLPRYVSYYAVESVLYITLVYAALLFLSPNWKSRLLIVVLCCSSMVLLLISGIRSAFAAAAIGVLTITLFKLHSPKRITAFLALFALCIALVLIIGKDNTQISRYADLANTSRYTKQEGMTGRYFIWEGVSEIVEKRPLLGFGPGWQKLPAVASDTGLISTWGNDKSTYGQMKHWYFSLEPGKPNPHNLIFQTLFETGWLGLLSYFAVLGSLFWSGFTARSHTTDKLGVWLRYAIAGYGLSYIVIDITNAFLFHNTMVALMLITVLIRQTKTPSAS